MVGFETLDIGKEKVQVVGKIEECLFCGTRTVESQAVCCHWKVDWTVNAQQLMVVIEREVILALPTSLLQKRAAEVFRTPYVCPGAVLALHNYFPLFLSLAGMLFQSCVLTTATSFDSAGVSPSLPSLCSYIMFCKNTAKIKWSYVFLLMEC